MGFKFDENIKRRLKIALFILLSVIGIILLILPKEFFDQGQSVCLSVVLFDKKCYGCGMTRAIQHLIHFDFKGAAFYNKLSFIVFPLLVYMLVKELLFNNKSKK